LRPHARMLRAPRANGGPKGLCAEEGRSASVYQTSSKNKGIKKVKLPLYRPWRYWGEKRYSSTHS